MTTSLRRTAAAAAFAFLLAGGTAATAKDVTIVGQRADEDRLTERVGYGDLDLAERKGQSTLDRRVRKAAHNVCKPVFTGTISLRFTACHSEAMAGARPQMAQAIERAAQLASTGRTSLPEVAIAVRAATGAGN